MGHALFVFGAAGSGKTTFCRNLREYCAPNRSVRLINLDPAQEEGTDFDIDLCDYITVGEVMEEMDFGPNGALFYALEEMSENIDELHLEDFEDDFFVFDCPGQIELFLHSDILVRVVDKVKNFSKIAVVYLFDSSNFLNSQKLLYSLFCSTISTYRFCLPVINIISKADLLDENTLERICSGEDLFQEESEEYGNKSSVIDEMDNLSIENKKNHISSNLKKKNNKMLKSMIEYVNNNSMMSFLPINWKDESTAENLILFLDNILQKYDDDEPKEYKHEE